MQEVLAQRHHRELRSVRPEPAPVQLIGSQRADPGDEGQRRGLELVGDDLRVLLGVPLLQGGRVLVPVGEGRLVGRSASARAVRRRAGRRRGRARRTPAGTTPWVPAGPRRPGWSAGSPPTPRRPRRPARAPRRSRPRPLRDRTARSDGSGSRSSPWCPAPVPRSPG